MSDITEWVCAGGVTLRVGQNCLLLRGDGVPLLRARILGSKDDSGEQVLVTTLELLPAANPHLWTVGEQIWPPPRDLAAEDWIPPAWTTM